MIAIIITIMKHTKYINYVQGPVTIQTDKKICQGLADHVYQVQMQSVQVEVVVEVVYSANSLTLTKQSSGDSHTPFKFHHWENLSHFFKCNPWT